jgi:hypothetical protein
MQEGRLDLVLSVEAEAPHGVEVVRMESFELR